MPGRRAEMTAETRGRLIEAATQLVSEVGPHATSIQAVADLSGISRGSIAWHFGSKEGLIVAVFEEVFAGIVEKVEVLAGSGSSDNVIENLINVHNRITEGRAGAIVGRSIADILHGSAEMSDIYFEGVERVRDAYIEILQGAEWPDGEPHSPELLADLILDCGLGINTRAILRQSSNREQRFAQLGRMLGLAFKSPGAETSPSS